MDNRAGRTTILFSVTVLLVAMLTPINSFAIFVEDPTEWLKTMKAVEEAKKQYDQLKKQYDVLNKQYTLLNNQYTKLQSIQQDAEGHYGYGDLLNSNKTLSQQREWSPDSWQDSLKGLSGGNPARYQQLVNLYKKSNPTLSQQDYEKGASKHRAQSYQHQVQVNQAASVQASYAFNNIKTHLQNVHALSAQIEKTKNTKAAVDLNSRLIAELSYIAVQELKMQTVLNQQLAEQSASDIASETDAAKFNQLPKQ